MKNFFSRNWLKICLIVVLIIAAVFRVVGTYPGHNPYHPDEGKAGYISAWKMFNEGNLNPLDYCYPSAVPLTELLVFSVFIFPFLWLKAFLINSPLFLNNLDRLWSFLKQIVEQQTDLSMMYWGRHITAFFGFLTVFLVYLVAKKVYQSRLAGVLAALVLAVNFRAVMNSHFDLPDTFNAFYLILAFLTTLQLIKKPTAKNYLLSGIAMGLSFSAKLQFFSFIPFALLHTTQAFKGKKNILAISQKFFSRGLLIAIFSLLITVILVNFDQLLAWETVLAKMHYQAAKYGMGVFNFNLYSFSYLVNIVLTPPVSLAVLGGIIFGLEKKWLPTSLILSVVLVFLFFFLYLTSGGFYTRNFITIIPFLAILAGGFLFFIQQWLDKKLNPPILKGLIFFLLLLSILIPSIRNTIIHCQAYSQPWGLIKTRVWLKDYLGSGKTIAVHPWNKYILFSLPSIDVEKNLSFIPLEPELAYSGSELREEGADYALIGIDVLSDSTSIWWMKSETKDYWQRPVAVSKNTFSALAVKELSERTLFASLKPWQAPDNNYLLVSIPPLIHFDSKPIEQFSFDDQESASSWQRIDGLGGKSNHLIFDFETGHLNKGSLKVDQVRFPFPVVRWISPVFSVEPGFGYQIKAWLKAGRELDQQSRDGFLRLEFYEIKPERWDEGTQSTTVYLSPRYFGQADWQELDITALAPEGSKYATLSFQVNNPSASAFWLDDLTISQSLEKPAPSQFLEGTKFVLPDEILVPFSTGGH